ncbi:hypothetical protein HNO86_03715 [Pseudomonas sp. C1C7]|uniref:DUF6957 family protein n=1 Tax=Pseudomonas sp. C1C7 TaxID=2735272 RepID=UPI0015868A0E|nr:hypothetical protein [Pseudomonas sp. C1C7]NUT74146.1 hypothetical protein [Pseudomonas sp. C1C7]
MNTDNGRELNELTSGTKVTKRGTSLGLEELIATVTTRYPSKPFCLVRNWTIFIADLTPHELKTVERAGHLPFFVYALEVIFDSEGRFQPGNWVRSSMCVQLIEGFLFETRNTVYILVGDGVEEKASLKTIFSFQ